MKRLRLSVLRPLAEIDALSHRENNSYLPDREADVYKELAELSEWSQKVRSHLASLANLLPRPKG